MQTVTTIGFDIAKSVFQAHGVDAAGQVVIRRQLKRRAGERRKPICARPGGNDADHSK
jgi:transposase